RGIEFCVVLCGLYTATRFVAERGHARGAWANRHISRAGRVLTLTPGSGLMIDGIVEARHDGQRTRAHRSHTTGTYSRPCSATQPRGDWILAQSAVRSAARASSG